MELEDTLNNNPAVEGEGVRDAFEAYWRESRAGNGKKHVPNLLRLGDDTYYDPSTQRHWWTWQQAIAGRAALSTREQAQIDALVDQLEATAGMLRSACLVITDPEARAIALANVRAAKTLVDGHRAIDAGKQEGK